MDQGLLVTNVAGLARAAKALKGSVLVDPIFKDGFEVYFLSDYSGDIRKEIFDEGPPSWMSLY